MIKVQKGALLLLLTVHLFTQSASAQFPDSTQRLLSMLVNGYKSNEPGGVLIISRDGKTIFDKAFGMANLEQQLPINDSTLFEAASVTKQFTATGVLLLVKKGLLSLNDEVHKYFPELPDYGHPITIKQLLTHTSGLKDWRNVTYISSWPTGDKVMNQVFALDMIFRQQNLNYNPGLHFSYTNAGFDLCASLIEKLTGVSYAKFIMDSLLIPAGMTHSFIRKPRGTVMQGMSTSYYKTGNVFHQKYITDESYGASGLITTAADLQKWILYINQHFSENDIISKLRYEHGVLTNGQHIDYTCGGIYIKDIKGIKQITHSGFVGAFRSLTTYYPQYKIAVSYMGNNQEISTTDLNNKIFKILFGKEPVDAIPYSLKDTIQIAKEDIAGLQGSYRNVSDSSDVIQMVVHGNKLYQFKALLHPLPKQHFMYDGTLYSISADGTAITTIKGEIVNTYKKVVVNPIENDLKKNLIGTYYSRDADVLFSIQENTNGLMVNRFPGDSILIQPVYNNGAHVGYKGFDHGLRAIYDFEISDRTVSRLTIHLPRANSIHFYKQ